MNKREFLKTGLLGMVGIVSLPALAGKKSGRVFSLHDFKLPDLPYAYNALEPYIDRAVLLTHHAKLHADYTLKFNEAIQKQGFYVNTAREIFENASSFDKDLVENGGGYFNHKIFWPMLTPNTNNKASANLESAINSSFGSFEAFKSQFRLAAKTAGNPGWTWLIFQNKQLKITNTSNQNNPFMNTIPVAERGYPLLCIDLWDHAMDPKYHNQIDNYVDAFWKIVNWDTVNERFKKAVSK